MQVQMINQKEEAWVKILSKGLITIPKSMRNSTGMQEGEVAMITRIGKTLIIKPRDQVEYRMFTDEEIKQWSKDDKLPKKLAQEAKTIWSDIS